MPEYVRARASGDPSGRSHTPPSARKARFPGYLATPLPRSAAIAMSRLYLAIRSLRQREPVLIWPAPVATARSLIVVSSVSPERCEMTQRKPALWAVSIAAGSSREPPW